MSRGNQLIRLFRALSGRSQREFSEATGINLSLLGLYEQGRYTPGAGNLERGARGAGLTVEDGERILDYAEALRRERRRAGSGAEELAGRLAAFADRVSQRLLRLPMPDAPPVPEDRRLAAEQWRRLESLPPDAQLAVIRMAPEFQTWALAELVCGASVAEASRDVKKAEHLARLAAEIAERVRGPESWRRRLQGWVAGHPANVERVQGELQSSRAGLEAAKRLYASGSDPGGLLDPGRLLDLQASLCRDERRFEEALALLDEAQPISRCPARILIKKGFTLEAMGEYERAVETLREAGPLLDRESEPRLYYMQRFNLAVNASHVHRHAEAAGLLQEVRELVSARGDKIEEIRVTWLEGRIAAGLGRREEALALLAEARRRFAEEQMSYDVALALLEEAVLLLEEGRTAEVKALAADLQEVFRSKGVHLEALAALKLFHQAAEQEAATAAFTRRLLAYLFRARHDEALRFPAA